MSDDTTGASTPGELYEKLWKKVEAVRERGGPDEDEDPFLDEMDLVWKVMSAEARAAANAMSQELLRERGPRTLVEATRRKAT